uniref:Uncharacterized protein n=1 Tax=Daucus carota subsp. sativus TaxID=79200 RepID=A0A166CQS8_DAUCS
MCVYYKKLMRLVLFYGGGFVTSTRTGLIRYAVKKIMVKDNIDIVKLSVSDIRKIFLRFIGENDHCYYLCNGITPTDGYKLFLMDDQVPELVYLAKRLGGDGGVRLYVHQPNFEADRNENELLLETNLGTGTEELDNNLRTGAQGDISESESNESERSFGDGSESDLSDYRRIIEKVRKEQKPLDDEHNAEIKKSLLKYKNRAEESDSDYYGSNNSEDETDEDVAYAEPHEFKKKTKMDEIFNINTAGKDIKWVPGLIYGDKCYM